MIRNTEFSQNFYRLSRKELRKFYIYTKSGSGKTLEQHRSQCNGSYEG